MLSIISPGCIGSLQWYTNIPSHQAVQIWICRVWPRLCDAMLRPELGRGALQYMADITFFSLTSPTSRIVRPQDTLLGAVEKDQATEWPMRWSESEGRAGPCSPLWCVTLGNETWCIGFVGKKEISDSRGYKIEEFSKPIWWRPRRQAVKWQVTTTG